MPTYRKDNFYLTIDGETRTITQWSEETGVSRQAIRERLRLGWEPVYAVFAEPRKYHLKKKRKRARVQTTPVRPPQEHTDGLEAATHS